MGWLRLFVFTGLAAMASGATRPPLLADLADRARSLPPEFAADALLRIAAAQYPADAAWRQEAIEDAFRLAAAAQEPFPRRNWTGKPVRAFDKAYIQGLDACTLRCRAVHDMLALDYRKAREMFGSIPTPQIPRLSCDDSLVYDLSIFYTTAGEVAARAFSRKEVANDAQFHFLERYAVGLTSPVEAAPVARLLTGAPLKNGQFEALVDALAAALPQLSADRRSMSAAEAEGAAIEALAAECTRRRVSAQPLLDGWHTFLSGNAREAGCVDGKSAAAGRCASPECRQLATRFSALIMGANAYALTAEQKANDEWRISLRAYLAALAEWKCDNPSECFEFKDRFYGELFHTTPNGPERDLVLGALLGWLQRNDYQRDHRVE